MTLDGTNTWVLRAPRSDEIVIVDPALTTTRIWNGSPISAITLVLISHRHADHTDGIDKLVDRTGAVVRSVGSASCRSRGPLTDGESSMRRPAHHGACDAGHTADSVSFLLDDAVLTADTVLGRGTT